MLSPEEERVKIRKCAEVFENLGWNVSFGKVVMITREKGFRLDFVLNYKGEEYGFVDVLLADNMGRAQEMRKKLDSVINVLKPRIFVITNGFVYDVYHYGEFYGCLTVPPAPEDVDILLGGEDDV